MNCRYEIKMSARCPVDDSVLDEYDVTIESHHEVLCEKILKLVQSFVEKAQTQEAITETLGRELIGCRVTTVGYHSGVRTTVTVP